MTAFLLPNGKQQYFDTAGDPLVGGKVYTYAAGTSTPKTTYQDSAATIANANPVILDSRGEAVIFWDGSYKVVLKDSLENTIYTVDGFTDPGQGVTTLRTELASTSNLSQGASLVGQSIQRVADIATLRTIAGNANRLLYIMGNTSEGDGGQGLFRWVSAASAADDNGVTVLPTGHVGTGRWKRILEAGIVHVAMWGASPTVSAATNVTAINRMFTYIQTEGGLGLFEPRVIYPVNAKLTFFNTSSGTKNYYRAIDGQGATLDFSASGLTSGTLLELGASALGNASESMWSEVKNLNIKGPENDTNITPRYIDNPSTDAVAATTTTGVDVSNGLKLHLRNIFVSHCWKGFRWTDCWWSEYSNLDVRKCIIGYHIDEGCTQMTLIKPECNFVTYGYVIRPDTPSAAITTVTMLAPHVENTTQGFHLDPVAASGTEIQNVVLINPYMEKIYYDMFRIGIAFDATPSSAGTRGANRAGYISSFSVVDGRMTGDGVSVGYGTNRKAFAFPSTRKLASGSIAFPCTEDDILNRPQRVAFRSTARAEDITTQRVDYSHPGYGACVVSSAGAFLGTKKGNISGVTKISTGTYDITFLEAYASSDDYAVTATSRVAGFYCSVNDPNTTAGVARIEVRSDAGALTDQKFSLSVEGNLSAY